MTCVDLVSRLEEKITSRGYGTLSKNDLYDLLISLIDSYTSGDFFTNRSIHERSVKLRIPPSRVKTIDHNIFLKYKSEEENKSLISNFLQKMAGGQIKLNVTEQNVEFMVESYFVRSFIENQMKQMTGVTIDFKRNREIIVVPKPEFFEWVRRFHSIEDKKAIEKVSRIIGKENVKISFITFLDFIKDIIKEITVSNFPDIVKLFLG